MLISEFFLGDERLYGVDDDMEVIFVGFYMLTHYIEIVVN